MIKTIQDISNETGTTRQNVSQLLKRGMRKVYQNLRMKNPDCSPFETVVDMSRMFSVVTPKDFQHFFHDFPKDIRREVIIDAFKYEKIKGNVTVEELLTKSKKHNDVSDGEVLDNEKPKRRGRPPRNKKLICDKK